MTLNYAYLNGVKTYSFFSKDELNDFIDTKKIILIAINAEKILNSKNSITDIINNNIGYPDGVGAVWALKRKGFRRTNKIPGCELWLDIIRRHYKNKSLYLIGSKQKVIETTIDKLHSEYPGINILNFRNGYIETKSEKEKLFSDIENKSPDIVLVALGSPKQELFMNELFRRHKALYLGLGGSFDVYTNQIKRAPRFFIWLNLEWLYRIIMQPSRINRLVYQIKFLINIIFNRI